MAQVSIGTGVQIGASSSTPNPYNISNSIAPGEVNLISHVEQHTNASSTATIEDITGTSGTVSSFQFIACSGTSSCAGAGSANDAIVNIYIDGSGTPSVTFDLGIIGTHWANSGAGNFADNHASAGRSTTTGEIEINLKYPMYFSTEWRATITVPSSLTTGLYWFDDVRYTTAYTNALRLKSSNVTLANSVSTNLATTPFTFLNLGSGSGTIAALFISTQTATNYTYLEAGFNAYLDGAGSPQYMTSGGEDFPLSAWYFNGPTTFQMPWSYLSNIGLLTGTGSYGLDFNTDLLEAHGGIPFTNGVVFKWEKIVAKSTLVTTSVNIGYLCLYYQ